jgi:hypothetical protein
MEPPVSDAVIIPFPNSRAAAPRPAPDARLHAALLGLQSALADQAQAIASWRFAVAELGVGVAALGCSVGAYQGSLDQLDVRLAGLHDGARRLHQLADGALAREG